MGRKDVTCTCIIQAAIFCAQPSNFLIKSAQKRLTTIEMWSGIIKKGIFFIRNCSPLAVSGIAAEPHSSKWNGDTMPVIPHESAIWQFVCPSRLTGWKGSPAGRHYLRVNSRCLQGAYTVRAKLAKLADYLMGRPHYRQKFPFYWNGKAKLDWLCRDPWHHGHQRPPTDAIYYNEVCQALLVSVMQLIGHGQS